MDTRAPRASSIVASFCRRPWRASVVGSVAPDGCPLVREAAGALSAAIRVDAQNGNTLATIPDGPAGVEIAGPWPRFDEPARLFHGGRSD